MGGTIGFTPWRVPINTFLCIVFACDLIFTQVSVEREIKGRMSVPWWRILTSKAMAALTICSWCSAWGVGTIATLTPSYIGGVLHFNLEDVSKPI